LKLLRVVLAATIGLSALTITAGSATRAGATDDRLHFQAHQDLGLTVIPCDECVISPVGVESGDHIGEFLINHGTLTDHNGRTIGHYAFHIVGTTIATGGPPEVQLFGTLALPGGQVVVQGLEEPPTDGGTIAITGGTGRYNSARGELRFHDIDDRTTDLTISLR
jgi:hypothetical protein